MAIYTTRSKRFRAGTYSMLLCAVATVLVILFNLILGALPSRLTQIDTSSAGYYDISEASETYLRELGEDVSLYLIAETNREDTVVSTLLGRIADCSDRITVRQMDPALYPTFTASYTAETLSPNAIIVESEHRFTVVNYSDLFYETARKVDSNETRNPNASYKTDAENTVYEITSHYAGESCILSAIDYTVSTNVTTVYQLSGHGETALESSYTERLNLENLKVSAQSASLLTSTGIPEDCSLLLILYPTTDFTSVELSFLRNYLNRGGKIMLMTSYASQLPNLNGLMEEYGMCYRSGVVLESSAANYLQYPIYIMPAIDETLTETPLMGLCHAIDFTESVPSSVTLTPLYASSESSYLKNVSDMQSGTEKGSNDPLGPFTLGMLAQNSQNGSVVCWISAGYFARTQCDALTDGVNLNAFTGLAGRLTERESRVPISVKTLDSGVLSVGNSGVSNLWGIVMIVLLPLGAIGTGLLIWIKRRNR